ncbi:MAG: LamG-like jellyroll fold domain-containing protein, partial [Pseudomonadota bacterium]
LQQEGSWVDLEGDSLTFSNWLPGQPDNHVTVQHHAIIASADGRWDDTSNRGGWLYDGGWSGGHVNLTVIEFESPPTNTNPIANLDGGFSVLADLDLRIAMADLLANDSDADGDTLSITAVSGATIDGTEIVFNASTVGTDGFTYTISDGRGGTDTADVEVVVTEPTAGPTPILVTNPFTMNGSTTEALVLSDMPAYQLASGTMAVTFTPTDVSGQRFLMSKDSGGYDDGGHFGLYILDGKIGVRFQSTDNTHSFLTDAVISPGEEAHVALTFGASNGFTVYVDGQAVGGDGYTGALIGNTEPIVLGATQWASSDGVANRLDLPFDGEIARFEIYDEVLDAAMLVNLADPIEMADQMIFQENSASLDGDTLDLQLRPPKQEIEVLANGQDSSSEDFDFKVDPMADDLL